MTIDGSAHVTFVVLRSRGQVCCLLSDWWRLSNLAHSADGLILTSQNVVAVYLPSLSTTREHTPELYLDQTFTTSPKPFLPSSDLEPHLRLDSWTHLMEHGTCGWPARGTSNQASDLREGFTWAVLIRRAVTSSRCTETPSTVSIFYIVVTLFEISVKHSF